MTALALGHSFGEWYVKTEASYDATGEMERTCQNCGHNESDTIPMLKGYEPMTIKRALEQKDGKKVFLEGYIITAVKDEGRDVLVLSDGSDRIIIEDLTTVLFFGDVVEISGAVKIKGSTVTVTAERITAKGSLARYVSFMDGERYLESGAGNIRHDNRST